MTNEECRTALKRIAGYMCARKDLEALTYAMNVLEHISSGLAKNSKELKKDFGELDCISRKRAIERLKQNLPISDGADNSRDRHRYMQSLADIQAIRELPSVTPQNQVYPLCEDCRTKMDEVRRAYDNAMKQESILDKIRAEIVEVTKCPYGTECLGANCPSNTDCMICGDHVLEILDKYRAESEE